MNDKMREEFEAAMRARGWKNYFFIINTRTGQYNITKTVGAYEGFQAARASQPAPVVPDVLTQNPLYPDESREDQYGRERYVSGWNACRAAMLAAAPQPPAEPLKELSDDELRDIDGLFILGRLEFARLAIAADRKLNGR